MTFCLEEKMPDVCSIVYEVSCITGWLLFPEAVSVECRVRVSATQYEVCCITGWLLFPEALSVECRVRVSATQTGPVYGAVTARPGLPCDCSVPAELSSWSVQLLTHSPPLRYNKLSSLSPL